MHFFHAKEDCTSSPVELSPLLMPAEELETYAGTGWRALQRAVACNSAQMGGEGRRKGGMGPHPFNASFSQRKDSSRRHCTASERPRGPKGVPARASLQPRGAARGRCQVGGGDARCWLPLATGVPSIACDGCTALRPLARAALSVSSNCCAAVKPSASFSSGPLSPIRCLQMSLPLQTFKGKGAAA